MLAKSLPSNAARRTARPQWLQDRRVWLLSGLAVASAGVALNWGWLSATGAAPVLLSVLPCLAMCGANLCLCRGRNISGSKPIDENAVDRG